MDNKQTILYRNIQYFYASHYVDIPDEMLDTSKYTKSSILDENITGNRVLVLCLFPSRFSYPEQRVIEDTALENFLANAGFKRLGAKDNFWISTKLSNPYNVNIEFSKYQNLSFSNECMVHIMDFSNYIVSKLYNKVKSETNSYDKFKFKGSRSRYASEGQSVWFDYD